MYLLSTDATCVCGSGQYEQDVRLCVQANCNTADQQAALALASALCVSGTYCFAIFFKEWTASDLFFNE